MTRIALAEGDTAGAGRDLDQAFRLLQAQEPENGRWRGRMLRLRARLAVAAGDSDEAQTLQREADRLDPMAAPASTDLVPRPGM